MMKLKPEYRDRDETDVAVLAALVGRPDEGMTVFELRAEVEVDIDTIEESLARLKGDRLIDVTDEHGRTVITPKQYVMTNGAPKEDDEDLVDWIRDRFPF